MSPLSLRDSQLGSRDMFLSFSPHVCRTRSQKRTVDVDTSAGLCVETALDAKFTSGSRVPFLPKEVTDAAVAEYTAEFMAKLAAAGAAAADAPASA